MHNNAQFIELHYIFENEYFPAKVNIRHESDISNSSRYMLNINLVHCN